MAGPIGDNQEDNLRKAVRQFIDARLQGQEPDIEEFIRQYPEFEDQIRQKVRNLKKIDTLFDSLVQADESEFAETATGRDPAGQELVGTQIGHYKLLNVVSEGGMGIVYLAEQKHPIKRRVALKVIKPGMDSKRVIARFESERQALALMDHPNIAQVYDAGTTESGRPYFAMEYVKGVSITEHCDRHKLTIEERLELFLQVCEAIQHAHQKGIIHRDIKPSNIQVSIQGEQVVPKVIDFGVAKAISQPLTERTLVTEQGQFVGTPEYMSPEQAEMTGQDIDTRSDIYSLGILLYELLTGVLPFEAEELRKGSLDQIRYTIREKEPKTPSTRLKTISEEESKKLARLRHTDVRTLGHKLHGDLDWITLKAMDKDRTRRYASAGEFAADIVRHLNHEPVVASPPSTIYRLKKFIRRHRHFVAAAAVVIVSLVLGLIVSTVMYFKAERARAEAEQQVSISQAVNDFLNNDLLASFDPDIAKGREITIMEVLNNAAKRLEGKFKDTPLIEASIRHTLGMEYYNLGKYKAAEPHLKRALELRQSQLGEENPDTLTTMVRLGWLYNSWGHRDEGEPLFFKVLEIRRRVLGEEHPDTLNSMAHLGWLYSNQRRYNEAEPLLVKALEIQRRVLGEEHPDTLWSMQNLGLLYSWQGHYKEAEPLLVKALEIRRRVLGKESSETLWNMLVLGYLYYLQGRYNEAEPLLVKSLEIRRRILGEEHPYTLWSMYNLGLLYSVQGRYKEAEPLLVKALEIQRRVLGEEHPNTLWTMLQLGWLYSKQGRYKEGEPLLVKVQEIRRRILGEEHPDTLNSMHILGCLYCGQGRYKEAEPLLVKARETGRRVLGEEHPRTLRYIGYLGCLYTEQGRYQEAESVLVNALEGRCRVLGEEHPETLWSMESLGWMYFEQGRYKKAEPLLVKALEIQRRVLGEEHPDTLESKNDLSMLYKEQARYGEAESLLLEAVEGRIQKLGEQHPHTKESIENLIELYEAWNKLEQADHWRAKLAAIDNGK